MDFFTVMNRNTSRCRLSMESKAARRTRPTITIAAGGPGKPAPLLGSGGGPGCPVRLAISISSGFRFGGSVSDRFGILVSLPSWRRTLFLSDTGLTLSIGAAVSLCRSAIIAIGAFTTGRRGRGWRKVAATKKRVRKIYLTRCQTPDKPATWPARRWG
jgi:hypothetical protein